MDPRHLRPIAGVCLALVMVSACGAPTPAAPGGPSTTASSRPAPTASPVGPSESPSLGARLDAMVVAFGVNGSALVALGDEVLLSKGFGLADTANGIPNTLETRFRLGSITKQFTAMAILILQSRGLLDVTDTACTYLDDCPSAWESMTIRQLLSHTAGMPNVTDLPDFESTKDLPSTPAQTLARVRELPLTFQPGDGWAYSNSGYIALGMIIERVSRMSYETFLLDEIFGPLEMRDTGYDHGDDGLAVGYRTDNVVADKIDMSVPYAAGGLFSTVLDLYRWDRALYTDRLVPKDLLASMFEPVAAVPEVPGFGYGYGFFVQQAPGPAWAWHSGGIDGFQTHYGRRPDERLSVIVLTNREDLRGYERLDTWIADLVLDR